jgi:nitric-oxide synthase, plant
LIIQNNQNSKIAETMATNDPVAAAAQKYKPMQSAVPGTTLGPIQIEAFVGGGVVFLSPDNFLIDIEVFGF